MIFFIQIAQRMTNVQRGHHKNFPILKCFKGVLSGGI